MRGNGSGYYEHLVVMMSTWKGEGGKLHLLYGQSAKN